MTLARSADRQPRPTGPRRLRWRAPEPAMALCTLAVLLPIAVSAVDALQQHWIPMGDNALTALRSMDVAHGHAPLVGPYTVASDWADGVAEWHPGPLIFWLLMPVYALGGWSTAGLVASAAALNAVFSVLALVAARRIGGRTLLLVTTAGLLALLWAMRGPMLYEPFSPYPAIPATFAYGLLLWSGSRGHGPHLAAGLVLGSFASQCHASHLGAFGLATATAGVALLVRWRRLGHAPLPARWIVGAVLALAFSWSGPVIDQLTGTHNLGAIVSSSLDAPVPRLGASRAVGLVAEAIGGAPPFVLRRPDTQLVPLGDPGVGTWLVLVAIGLSCVACALRARVRGLVGVRRSLGMLVALVVGLVVSTAALPLATIYHYQFGYLRAFSTLVWVMVLWTWVQVLRDLVGPALRRFDPAAVVAVPAVAVVTTAVLLLLPSTDYTVGTAAPVLGPGDRGTARRAVAAALDAVGPDDAPVVLPTTGIASYALVPTLAVDLERRGVAVAVLHGPRPVYGTHRRLVERPGTAVVHVVVGPAPADSPTEVFREAIGPHAPEALAAEIRDALRGEPIPWSGPGRRLADVLIALLATEERYTVHAGWFLHDDAFIAAWRERAEEVGGARALDELGADESLRSDELLLAIARWRMIDLPPLSPEARDELDRYVLAVPSQQGLTITVDRSSTRDFISGGG